jgi:hypothetical protein
MEEVRWRKALRKPLAVLNQGRPQVVPCLSTPHVVVGTVLEPFDSIVQRVARRQHQAGSDIAI